MEIMLLLSLMLAVLGLSLGDVWWPHPQDICRLPPKPGNCRGAFPRYYYDAKRGTCRKFSYGGCNGNENNFRTKQECMYACYDPNICHLEKDPGGCYGYFERYYYDKDSSSCEMFVYGGCDGNENNFEDERDCERTCYKREEKTCLAKPETGPCRARMLKYYYDPATGRCKRFVYGGCRGNGNRYDTKYECYDNCAGIRLPKRCLLDKFEGYGDRRYGRYYFDRNAGKCWPLLYRGQGGNGNNFRTLNQCRYTCDINDWD